MIRNGEKFFCIKDRYYYRKIINKSGKVYSVIKHDNSNSNVIIMDNESRDIDFYFLFNEIDTTEHYIFNDYFINLQEYRRIKLGEINEKYKCRR